MAVGQSDLSMPARGPELLFGRYELQNRLGSGGSAEVWRARDTRLDRDVAIKRLHAHLLPDAAAWHRFIAEARAAAGLTHPGIAAVHDIVADENSAAIVFELVDGEPLGARIRREGRISPAVALAIAADVADALGYAHTRGVLHRDIKPANVIVDRAGDARLVDFGIAQALDRTDPDGPPDGTVVGTLRYMAPEQLRDSHLSPATDVYALGLVLYEMLGGKAAFAGTDPKAIAAAQVAGVPPLEGHGDEIAAIVGSMVAYDPGARPADASELATLLRSVAAIDRTPYLPAPAAAIFPTDADADTAVTVAVQPPIIARTDAGHRRVGTRSGLLAAGLLLAVIGAVAAFGVLGSPFAAPGAPGGNAAAPASESPIVAPTPTPSLTVTPPSIAPSNGEGDDDKGPGNGKGKGKGKDD